MEMEELPEAKSPDSLETKRRLASVCIPRVHIERWGMEMEELPEAERPASLANKWRLTRNHVSKKVASKYQLM